MLYWFEQGLSTLNMSLEGDRFCVKFVVSRDVIILNTKVFGRTGSSFAQHRSN